MISGWIQISANNSEEALSCCVALRCSFRRSIRLNTALQHQIWRQFNNQRHCRANYQKYKSPLSPVFNALCNNSVEIKEAHCSALDQHVFSLVFFLVSLSRLCPKLLSLCQNNVAAGFLCHPEKEEGGDPKDVGAWPWLRMCSVLQVGEEAASLASLVMPCSPQPALRGLTVNGCTRRHTGILKRNSPLSKSCLQTRHSGSFDSAGNKIEWQAPLPSPLLPSNSPCGKCTVCQGMQDWVEITSKG